MKRTKGTFNRLIVSKDNPEVVMTPVTGYTTRDFGVMDNGPKQSKLINRWEVTVLASGFRVSVLEKKTLDETLVNIARVEALLDFNYPDLAAMIKATGKSASEIYNICKGEVK